MSPWSPALPLEQVAEKKVAEQNKPSSIEEDVKKQATKDLQKTRLCIYNLEGKCGFGATCAFAHSANEIRDVPNLQKTQLCTKFMEGTCSNENCNYAHGEGELRDAPNFKKKMCKWSSQGACRNGAKCGFAHSTKELKGDVKPPPGFEYEPQSRAVDPPWRRSKVAAPPGLEKIDPDEEDADASTVAPSSQGSKISIEISGDSTSTGLTEDPLFRMAAARGAAPLQQQVALMSSAVVALQAKLAMLQDMVAQSQVAEMQESIQQLNEQCWMLQNGMVEQPQQNTQKSRLNGSAAPFLPFGAVM